MLQIEKHYTVFILVSVEIGNETKNTVLSLFSLFDSPLFGVIIFTIIEFMYAIHASVK